MKTVLVAGAAGGIGEAAVRALLSGPDVQVFAQSRSAVRLEQLSERLEPALRNRMMPIVGDAGGFQGASRIAAEVKAAGGLDAAVAIFGRGFWTSGPTIDLPPEEWIAVLDEMLTAHFAFARALVPVLATRPGSVFLALGGSAAFEPARGAGLMSIAGAGQAMLARVLARERGDAGPRILELVIEGDVKTRESAAVAAPSWITADEAGGVVADLVVRGETTWQPMDADGPLLLMRRRHRGAV